MDINNGSLSLNIPEGFKVLSEEDYKNMGKRFNQNEFSIRDEERHIIFGIAWKKVLFFARKMALPQVTRNTERIIASTIPSFVNLANVSATIDGKEAYGFRYSYTTEGIKMMAEYYVLKIDKLYYSFNFMTREENFSEAYPLLKEIADTVHFH